MVSPMLPIKIVLLSQLSCCMLCDAQVIASHLSEAHHEQVMYHLVV